MCILCSYIHVYDNYYTLYTTTCAKIHPLPGANNGTQCSMDRMLIARVSLECIAPHARMIMLRIVNPLYLSIPSRLS